MNPPSVKQRGKPTIAPGSPTYLLCRLEVEAAAADEEIMQPKKKMKK